jgi:hypothetical protein
MWSHLIAGLLWTAPELLRMPESTRPPNGTQKGDVYSYSIIAQEIVLKDLPYAAMSAANLDPAGEYLCLKFEIFNSIQFNCHCLTERDDLKTFVRMTITDSLQIFRSCQIDIKNNSCELFCRIFAIPAK